MKLLHAALSNYRVHERVEVDFHEVTSLLGGGNEAGKSTLIEAVHRALFLPAKGGGAVHQSMYREGVRDKPTVDVHFEHDGRRFELHKHFGGYTSSRVELREEGGPALEGDEAEERLREITGAGLDKSPRKEEDTRKPWAHLWVWQGGGGETPAAFIADATDQLVNLTSKGAGAVTMSPVDTAVAARFQTLHRDTFGDKGGSKAKTRSVLGEAITLQDDCTARVRDLEATVEKLEGAAETHARAAAVLAKAAPRKEAVEAELHELGEGIAKAKTVELEMARARDHRDRLAADVKRGRDEAKQLREWDVEIAALAEKLDGDERAGTLATAVEQAAADLSAARAAYAEARAKSKPLAERQAKAEARVQLLDAREALARAEKGAARVAEIEAELAAVEEELKTLPAVKASALVPLRDYGEQVVQLEAELKSVQSTAVVVAAPGAVSFDGQAAAVGQEVALSAHTRITTADGLEIRLAVPGVADGEAVRARLTQLREKLAEKIGAYVVRGAVAKTVRELEEAVREREGLEQRREGLRKQLRRENAEEVTRAHRRAEADVLRFGEKDAGLPAFEGWTDPQNPPAAELLATREAAAYTAHLRTLEELERRGEALRERHDDAVARERAYAKTRRSDEDALRLKRGLRQNLLAPHGGSAEAFATALAEVEEAEGAATRAFELKRKAFEETQLEVLETRNARKLEQLAGLDRELSLARRDLHQAEGQLRPEAGVDPFTDIREAREALARAERDCERHTLDAAANALLDRLFQEEFDEANERVTKPLADRVAAYLQYLYGADTSVHLDYDGGAFGEFNLERPGMASFREPFSSLSGGAREQVAAAVRLATAEILAADHGGQLPVVFDDAFVNTDPERIPKVIDMLWHAADRGLQVIVSTCDPSRYEGIGKVKWRVTRGAGATKV